MKGSIKDGAKSGAKSRSKPGWVDRVLVYEEVTGGCAATHDERFLREAEIMVASLARDLVDSPLVGAVTLIRDARLSPARMPSEVDIVAVRSAAAAQNALSRELESLRAADAFWPIAPEEGGRLEALCAMASPHTCRLFNSAPAAVRIAASKFETAARLSRVGVACIPTWRSVAELLAHAEHGNSKGKWAVKPECFGRDSEGKGKWVVKPDMGAGGDGLRCVADVDAARATMQGSDIVQPYIEGRAMSVGLACAQRDFSILSVNEQHFGDHFGRLRACVVGHEATDALLELMRAVVGALPKLAAFVGVDILETAAREYLVVEVNPRLTTSYAGIRAAYGFNPVDTIAQYMSGHGDTVARVPKPLSEPPTLVEVVV